MTAKVGFAIAITGALVLGVFAMPVDAAPGSTVEVTVIDAYAPNASQAVPLTICIDNVRIADLTTAMRGGPFGLAQGTHRVEAFTSGGSCGDDDPVIAADVVVPDLPTATLLLGWGAQGGTATLLEDHRSCIPSGMALITLRNGGTTATYGAAPNVQAFAPGNEDPIALTVGVTQGGQTASLVDSGTFGSVDVVAGDAGLQGFGDMTFAAGTDTHFYVYGGAQGAAGAFTFTFPATACAPTSTVPGGPPATLPGQPTVPRQPAPPGATALLPRSVSPARPATAIAVEFEPTYTG